MRWSKRNGDDNKREISETNGGREEEEEEKNRQGEEKKDEEPAWMACARYSTLEDVIPVMLIRPFFKRYTWNSFVRRSTCFSLG